MNILETRKDLQTLLKRWKDRDDLSVAFVPTMGNLHAGHLRLVEEAHQRADRVLVSIFVNPLQFGAGEDFASYPRTLDEDRRALEDAGAHALFLPSVQTLYPRPMEEMTRIRVPGISEMLCGASRPGHFEGVATVVCKLFNLTRPDVAVFGEKDYQQLAIIRRMVADLDMPVSIVGVPTVREPDGLAMSSRNGYLTAEERRRAAVLQQVLQTVSAGLREGGEMQALLSDAHGQLIEAGFRPDYLQVRRRSDLAEAVAEDRELVILAAAYLGRARLIDNLSVDR